MAAVVEDDRLDDAVDHEQARADDRAGEDVVGPRTSLSRRELLIGGGGLLVGAGAVLLRARWTDGIIRVDGELPPVPTYDVGAVEDIAATIEADGFYPVGPETPRVVVVGWDPRVPFGDDGLALYEYGPSVDGLRRGSYDGNPVVRDDLGLLVLQPRTETGCLAQHCPGSGWFEDPCHGALFNGWGEWVGGNPHEHGLPRHHSQVVDGRLIVSASTVPGRRVTENVLGDDGNGPSCVIF